MQTTTSTGLRLAILTTAIGATAAGSAQAALVSTAPAGFVPVTVTASSGSYSFDVDGNGSNDFTIAGSGGATTGISLSYLDTATSGAASFFNQVFGTTASDLSLSSVKSGSVATISPNFGSTGNEFAALATNATFTPVDKFGSSTVFRGTLGYLQGIYTIAADPSFELLDYGVVTADTVVPEPASLALLATGAAGIAALRRRRRAA